MTENCSKYMCPASGLTDYQLYSFVRLLHLPDETERDQKLRAEALEELRAYGSTEQTVCSHIFHHIGQCMDCRKEYAFNYHLRQELQLLQEKTLHERLMEEAQKQVKRFH